MKLSIFIPDKLTDEEEALAFKYSTLKNNKKRAKVVKKKKNQAAKFAHVLSVMKQDPPPNYEEIKKILASSTKEPENREFKKSKNQKRKTETAVYEAYEEEHYSNKPQHKPKKEDKPRELVIYNDMNLFS